MLALIVIPALIGVFFRVLFIEREKGFYATVAALAVALAFIANAVIFYATGHWGDGGSEGPGLLAWAVGMAFLGSALTELLRWLYIKFK